MTGQLNNKGEEGLRTFYLFPSIRMHRHRGMFVSSINLWLSPFRQGLKKLKELFNFFKLPQYSKESKYLSEAREPNHITNLEVKKPHFIRLETLWQALAVTAVSTSGC